MSIGVQIWSHYGEGEKALRVRTVPHDEEFSALVLRNARLMFRVAYGLLRNRQDAEDAVQDALLKLYRTGGWSRIQEEKAFLARSAWRAALDRIPPRGREMEDIAGLQLASPRATPEDAAATEDQSLLLRRLIDGLPLALREVILLSALEEMTSREVALVLGTREGTVRTRLMRAKAELRKRFEALNGGRT